MNPMQIIEQFNQFQSTFRGNPQEEVQKLLNSGQMTQAQYNELTKMATQFQAMLRNFSR